LVKSSVKCDSFIRVLKYCFLRSQLLPLPPLPSDICNAFNANKANENYIAGVISAFWTNFFVTIRLQNVVRGEHFIKRCERATEFYATL